jgi:hypothetical protein
VRHQARQQREAHRDEQPTQHEPVEGKIEDEKPDVVTELRIHAAEGTAV